MSEKKPGHFEILPGFPSDVVAISAKGRIDRHAYEDVLIPLIDATLAREGKVKVLYIIGPEFEGFTAGAAWDDTKLGFSHLSDFARFALVTDVEWIRMAIKLFAPLMGGRMRVFNMAEIDTAKNWITAYNPAPEAGPEVAATHKLSTLEDKIPPQD